MKTSKAKEAASSSAPCDPRGKAMFSLSDLARLLNVGRRTLHTWGAAGTRPAPKFHIGKVNCWKRETTEEWIESQGRDGGCTCGQSEPGRLLKKTVVSRVLA